jgi:hypothetical protein
MFEDLDRGDLWFFGLGVLFIGFIIFIAYLGVKIDNERETFKEHCIDAGGYPVSPLSYVKGHGNGHLCINPNAIIELKDEGK